MQTNRTGSRVRTLTQFALLVAVELILGFTPLGLIMVPPVAITIMHIPVIICGVVMGPLYGGLLGLCFGLCSLVKATTSAVSLGDMLFSPFLSGNPLASIAMCLIPRILLGIIAGYLFILLHKWLKNNLLSIGITAAVATVFHTLGVLGLMSLFFSAFPLHQLFAVAFTLNGGLEILSAVVVCVPVCAALLKYAPIAPKSGPHTGGGAA